MKSQKPEFQDDDELGPSEFSAAVTRIAVAQICQSVGFRAARRSALETLMEVAARYLQALGKSAASSANSSGRTQSNLYDVVSALEDIHGVLGFAGASNVSGGGFPWNSSILADTMKFVAYAREIPFAKPLPRHKCSSILPNLGRFKCLDDNRLNHIPKWLPDFPKIDGKEWNAGRDDSEKGNADTRAPILTSAVGLDDEKMALVVVERECKGNWELPVVRKSVSFKIGMGVGKNEVGEGERFGVDLRSGICKGFGKRVSCQNWKKGVGDDVASDVRLGSKKRNKVVQTDI